MHGTTKRYNEYYNNETKCKFQCESEANTEHIFFECPLSKGVGSWLISLFRDWNVNTADLHSILRLETNNINALTWIAAQSFYFIWMKRMNSKEARVEECLATLTDRAKLLQETRHSQISNGIIMILKHI